MRASCYVGGCDWQVIDPSPIELEAAAELHRAEHHDWVRPGRCHRTALEPHEQLLVDALVAGAVAAREAAALARTVSVGHEGRSKYDRS